MLQRELEEVSAFETIAIIGLGLIGGSLARDLAGRGIRVLGADSDPQSLRAALDEGVLAGELGPGLDGIEEADAMVLAVPVNHAPELLDATAPRLRHLGLITDVGSTKGRIVEVAEELELSDNFVGAHPLTGGHQGGWRVTRPGLFDGTRVFLTPTARTAGDALSAAHSLWTLVGASTEVIDADSHDRLMAWLSHLPQSLATALALALAGEGLSPTELGPGGLDMTRLAASSPELWTGITIQNADALLSAIRAFSRELGAFEVALERRDAAALMRLFSGGQAWRRG